MIIFPIKMTTNLGNWLFQYAVALGYGEAVGAWPEYEGADKKLFQYAELFKGVDIVNCIPDGTVQYHQPRFNFDPLPKKTSENLMLWGYYQSEKFFADPQGIRTRFGVSADRRENLQTKYGEWLRRPNLTGISVRRGDYMRKPQHHPFVGERYFEDCLARMPEAQDFVVCSDDMAWCKAFFPKRFPERHFLFVEGEDVLNQLYIHTLCQNNIISNSSFSWWGAWLNPNPTKRVLAPSLWFGFDLYRDPDEWKDIYFKGVEVVPNRYSATQYCHAWTNVVYWKTRRALGNVKRRFWK